MDINLIAIIIKMVFIIMIISSTINMFKNIFRKRILAVIIFILSISFAAFGVFMIRDKLPETQHPIQYIKSISVIDEATTSNDNVESLSKKAGVENLQTNDVLN